MAKKANLEQAEYRYVEGLLRRGHHARFLRHGCSVKPQELSEYQSGSGGRQSKFDDVSQAYESPPRYDNINGEVMLDFPEPFKDLEILSDWCLSSSAARMVKRSQTEFLEIQEFYDTLLPRMPAIVAYLATLPPRDLSTPDQNLLSLTLSLAELGSAVEWYKQTQVKDGIDVTRIRYRREF